MQWFEKIYKERFSTENIDETESGLDGIDSSELWAQISKSIPQEEPTKIAHPWWRALGIMLILSLFTTGLFFYNKNNTQISDQAVVENNITSVKQNYKPKSKNLSTSLKTQDLLTQDSNSKKSNSKELNSRDLNTQDSNTKNYIPKSTNKNLESNKKIPTPIANNEANAINTSVTKPINKDNISSNLNTKTLLNQKEELKKSVPSDQKPLSNHLELNTDNTKSGIDISDQNSSLIDKAQNAQSIISTNNEINSLENQNTPGSISIASPLDSRTEIFIDKLVRDWIQSPERNIKSPLINPFTTPTKITNPPSPWSIKFSTQINTFDLQYKDDTNAEVFASQANQSIDSLQYGSGLGVHLGYNINRTWSISTGLEYNRYENKLSTVITTNILVFDSIYQKDRNAKNIRTVRHANKISTISIPLNISYDYSLNQKFSLGTSIGFAYSLVTSQSGRILGRNNSIIDFDSDLNKQYGNYFSLRFNPYIRYRLLDNFDISMDIGFSMQNHGSPALVDLKQGSSISTIGLGLKYNFD